MSRRHDATVLASWAPALLLLLAPACSGGSSEAAPPREGGNAEALPDPAEAGLITPEEATQAAQETIDASNAEGELDKLREEIEGG